MRSPTQAELRQAAAYAAVGAGNTVVSAAVYAVLPLPAPAAAAVAFLAGAVHGYAWNRRWTFRTRGSPFRYLVVQAAGLAALSGLVWLVPGTMVAYAAALAAVTTGTFLANRGWAFRLSGCS